MPNIYRVASININGATSAVKHTLLQEFIRKQELDITFLQEVTQAEVAYIPRYNTQVNLGTDQRGTAIITKEEIDIRAIKRIPSGRGIAVDIGGIWYVNVYAPSGAEKSREREEFFNTDLLLLLPDTPTDILLAGDFNCIVPLNETTGSTLYSKTLEGYLLD